VKAYREAQTPSIHYRGSETMRGGVLVDPDMQKARIRNHCYLEDQESWGVRNGKTTKTITRRCPIEGKGKCEIYQDQIALGMRTEVLPCCGAIIPDEVRKIGDSLEVFDKIEVLSGLREVLQSQEIYQRKEVSL